MFAGCAGPPNSPRPHCRRRPDTGTACSSPRAAATTTTIRRPTTRSGPRWSPTPRLRRPTRSPTSTPSTTEAPVETEAPTTEAETTTTVPQPHVVVHAMGETEVPGAPTRVVVLDSSFLDASIALGCRRSPRPKASPGRACRPISVMRRPTSNSSGLTTEPNLEQIAALRAGPDPRCQGASRGAVPPAQSDRPDRVQRVVGHRLEEPGDDSPARR